MKNDLFYPSVTNINKLNTIDVSRADLIIITDTVDTCRGHRDDSREK